MYFLYNILVYVTSFVLRIAALFNTKLRLFVSGRSDVFKTLRKQVPQKSRVIWFHAASLGEFEQGLPVMERVKKTFPEHTLLVTFFSPSGYEIKKDHPVPDISTYLPLDTLKNAKRFMEIVQPELAVFIKYEFWPNYLKVLKEKKIKTLIISAIFRKNQFFFKSYGGFMRKSLKGIDHFFVQDTASALLLNSIGVKEVTVSGDTRFDRVLEILERDNTLSFMKTFCNGNLCVVAGSTWPEDEALLIPYINEHTENTKFVLAPHTMKPAQIQKLRESIRKKVLLFSEKENKDISSYDVLIVDTIGLLTRIYSYAQIAYVGGGMGTSGLHNTLEPAVFGIPVIIGPNYHKFQEAVALVEAKGILSVSHQTEFTEVMNTLIADSNKREKTGNINASYIQKNGGAGIQILESIRILLNKNRKK